MDELFTAAGFLGVPWDSGALRPDGTLYWDLPPPHVLTRRAIMCHEDDVTLFYADDEATVSAEDDHRIWGILETG